MKDRIKEVLEKCRERGSREEDNPICQKCDKDPKSVVFGDIGKTPKSCPYKDPYKKREKILVESFARQLKPIVDSFYSTHIAMENLVQSMKMIEDVRENLCRIKEVSPALKAIQQNSRMIKAIADQQKWAERIVSTVDVSPILKSIEVFRKINFESTVPVTSFKQIVEDEEELDEVLDLTKRGEDAVFNIGAYPFLFNLERFLRDLIQKRIIDAFPGQLEQKIPLEILNSWEERKRKEEESKHCDDLGYELIEYSDFTDLKVIFEKGRNKELFSDLISEEDLKVVLSKLHELDPLRKKIAHSRLLTEREFEIIRLYAEQIFRIFSK